MSRYVTLYHVISRYDKMLRYAALRYAALTLTLTITITTTTIVLTLTLTITMTISGRVEAL